MTLMELCRMLSDESESVEEMMRVYNSPLLLLSDKDLHEVPVHVWIFSDRVVLAPCGVEPLESEREPA